MKISVITPTCRDNPRLAEMARTLAATALRTPDVELEWILVDEKHATRDMSFITDELDALLHVRVVEPLESSYRTGDKSPAHNSARQAGLNAANGDYIVLLNDCNVVSVNWLGVARDCAAKNLGWSCPMEVVNDMVVPLDGVIAKGHQDLLRPIQPTLVPRAAWGAPRHAFQKIRGFDLAYDGQRHGNDTDAAIRLNRAGIQFVTTKRATTIQLRRTKLQVEITTRKDALFGARNKQFLAELNADRNRILPRPKPSLAPAPAVVAAPAAPAEPARPSWKRKAPVVGGKVVPRPNRSPRGRNNAVQQAAPVARPQIGRNDPFPEFGVGAEPVTNGEGDAVELEQLMGDQTDEPSVDDLGDAFE